MPREVTTGKDEEFGVPPITVSPITGATGSISWGGLNKFNLASRQVISDVEADELINWLPQLAAFQIVPSPSAVIATLPATVIWSYADVLNGNLYTWYLCANGHIYQVSTGGTITDLGGGFSTATNSCDIVMWQGTQIMISDLVAQNIYSWNGSTLSTVFTLQPCAFLAVYASRLWMANNLVITWTNAGTNNSLGGDSGSFAITDGRCTSPIIAMVDALGSLYVFGSNWIKTINNLNDVGSPPVLTFQQPTLQTKESLINKWSLIQWGGDIYFANTSGFWKLSGATPLKISQALDGFFQNIDFTKSSFSGAYGRIYGMPCVFWQVYWNGDQGHTVFGYTMNQLWFRVIPVDTNGNLLRTGIGAAVRIAGSVSAVVPFNSPIVYSTDGTRIYNLFGGSTTVTAQFNSKIWDFFSKITYDMFTSLAVQFVVFGQTTLTICEVDSSGIVSGPAQPAACSTYTYNPTVGQWVNNAGVQGPWINLAGTTGSWSGASTGAYVLEQAVIPFQERNMGINLTFNGVGVVLQTLVISYRKLSVAKG